jgi:hypothetical protein
MSNLTKAFPSLIRRSSTRLAPHFTLLVRLGSTNAIDRLARQRCAYIEPCVKYPNRKFTLSDSGPEARLDRLLDQGLIALLQCSPAAFTGGMVPESAPGGSVPAGRAACFEFALWDIEPQPPDVRCWRCKPTPRRAGPPLVMFCNSTRWRRAAQADAMQQRELRKPRCARMDRSWSGCDSGI